MNGYYIWYQLKITTQALPEWFQNTKKERKNWKSSSEHYNKTALGQELSCLQLPAISIDDYFTHIAVGHCSLGKARIAISSSRAATWLNTNSCFNLHAIILIHMSSSFCKIRQMHYVDCDEWSLCDTWEKWNQLLKTFTMHISCTGHVQLYSACGSLHMLVDHVMILSAHLLYFGQARARAGTWSLGHRAQGSSGAFGKLEWHSKPECQLLWN